MKFYQPTSKNTVTLFWVVGFALLGTIVRTILELTGHKAFSYPYDSNPFISALYPMVIAGVPITVVAGFIFGVFTVGREETKLGKIQAGVLLTIILVLGYLTSYWMVVGGQF